MCLKHCLIQFFVLAETAFGIIPLANEYQMPDLLARCDTVLSKSIRSTSDMSYIYTTLKLCHLHNLEQTQTRCTELASELPLDQIKANKEKYEISSEVNEKILERGFRRQELDIVECKYTNMVLPLNSFYQLYRTRFIR